MVKCASYQVDGYILNLRLELFEKSLGNCKQLVMILEKHLCIGLVLA